ncbi:hypothetical protein [Alishewanella longhuensis]
MNVSDVIEEITAELQAHRRIQRVVRVSESGIVIDAYYQQFIGTAAQELLVGLDLAQLDRVSQSGLLAIDFVKPASKYIVYIPLVVPALS